MPSDRWSNYWLSGPTAFVKSACPLALNKVTISQTSAAFKMAAGPSSTLLHERTDVLNYSSVVWDE